MSEPFGKKKIQIETLIDNAWEWWSSKEDFEQENIVTEAYMKAKDIGEEEVEY